MSTTAELREMIKDAGLEYFGRYYSVYRGYVYDNQDPDFQGRLILKVPGVYENGEYHDYWAPVRGMFAGTGAGMYIIPKIGDQVWVTFENGDPSYPVWEHGWYGSKDSPAGAKPDVQLWQSYSGHRIELNDAEGLVRLKNKRGDVIELNSKGISLVTDKISLGTLNASAAKAVLGNALVSKLGDLMDQLGNLSNAISAITVLAPSGGGPTSTPVNAGAINSIGSQISAIKAGLNSILSGKVTLD